MITITHRLSMLKDCDMALRIEDGTVDEVSALARAFPDLVATLKARYQSHFGTRGQARNELVRGLVRSATMETHNAGTYPSAHRVRSALPRFIDMRDAVVREEWKRTLRKLGLDYEKN